MLRTCLAAADVDGSVSVFLEPIALYHTRDLYKSGDGGWMSRYRAPTDWTEAHVPVGRGRPYGDATRITLITFGNGVPMSLRVAQRLADAGYRGRVSRVCAADSYIPLGDAAAHVLVSEAEIEKAAWQVLT
jgi:2-oxoisovalerate dehydrogenase E1 component